MKKLLFLILMLPLMYVCNAQDKGQWQADWSAAFRMSGSTGQYVPFWARTGEDGILPVRSSGLLSAGGEVSYVHGNGWYFDAGLNAVGAVAQKSPLNSEAAYGFIDRLYASAGWKKFRLDVGMKPRHGDLGPLSITGGDILMSGNARNMPGINLSTDWLYFDKFRWVALKANLAHYHMLDKRSVMGAMVHDKSLSARISLGHRVDLMAGIHHCAMWGGVSQEYGPQNAAFDDYIKVFFASRGDEEDLLTDQLNAFGNHIGTEWARVVWYADSFTMQLQYDKLFEDNSGKNFLNAPDGVWTLNLAFSDRNALVSDLTYEFITTTWQSGPLHDRPATEEEMAKQDPDDPWYGKICLRGCDEYFNNAPYHSGWTYYGRTIGLPLIIPYAPDAEGVCPGVMINRVRGHHLGLAGSFARIPYKFKATFTENYGRYGDPLPDTPWQLSLAFEATIPSKGAKVLADFSAGLYADVGKLYPNSLGLTLKVSCRGSRRF